MSDPYGSARRDLDLLRRELGALCAGLRFPRQSDSAARVGEYRCILPDGRSIYVQGPLTPSGGRRRHGWSWRYSFEGEWRFFAARRDIIVSIVTASMLASLLTEASQRSAGTAIPHMRTATS